MSIYKNTTPITFTLANMPDISTEIIEQGIDIYDINLFLFKHPDLGPTGRNDGQTNDITKLSLKTMSDYILKYGVTLDDSDLPVITVTTVQTYNTISYTGTDEPPYGEDISSQNENRPATVKDLIDNINDNIIRPILIGLVDISAFTDEINTLTPDYVPSLDINLNETKMLNASHSTYAEIPVTDFIYIGNISGYSPGTIDGLIDPANLTILNQHTHHNKLFKSNLSSDVLTINSGAGCNVGGGGVHSMAIAAGNVTQTGSVVSWVDRGGKPPKLADGGRTKLNTSPITTAINGDIESQIQAGDIIATCLENLDSNAVNYMSSLKKVSVRYNARCYRIFEKQSG